MRHFDDKLVSLRETPKGEAKVQKVVAKQLTVSPIAPTPGMSSPHSSQNKIGRPPTPAAPKSPQDKISDKVG